MVRRLACYKDALLRLLWISTLLLQAASVLASEHYGSNRRFCSLTCENGGTCEFMSDSEEELRNLVQRGEMIMYCHCTDEYFGRSCQWRVSSMGKENTCYSPYSSSEQGSDDGNDNGVVEQEGRRGKSSYTGAGDFDINAFAQKHLAGFTKNNKNDNGPRVYSGFDPTSTRLTKAPTNAPTKRPTVHPTQFPVILPTHTPMKEVNDDATQEQPKDENTDKSDDDVVEGDEQDTDDNYDGYPDYDMMNTCDCDFAEKKSVFATKMCQEQYTEYCGRGFDSRDSVVTFCTNGGKCKNSIVGAQVAPGKTDANDQYQFLGCICPPDFYGPHCELLEFNEPIPDDDDRGILPIDIPIVNDTRTGSIASLVVGVVITLVGSLALGLCARRKCLKVGGDLRKHHHSGLLVPDDTGSEFSSLHRFNTLEHSTIRTSSKSHRWHNSSLYRDDDNDQESAAKSRHLYNERRVERKLRLDNDRTALQGIY